MRALENETTDAQGLIAMAEAEGEAAMVADAERASRPCAKRAEQRGWNRMLSGEADANDAYIEVHAGAGGTESQDWAEMLFRMYTRWAEHHGYKLRADRGKPRRGRRASNRRRCWSRATMPMAG